MDDIGHKSGHLMLITPERVFYAGLLGRPRATLLGCVQHLCLDRGRAVAHDRRWPRELWRNGRRAPERQAHHRQRPSLGAQHRDRAGERSSRRARRPRQSASRGLKAKLSPAASAPPIANCASITPATISPAPNSTPCVLAKRCRSANSIRAWRARLLQIGKFSGEPVTAASCAAEAGLSPSRFLHLFKEETGISFRSFRAWKRARHLLHFANQDINLAHLAQDIGYPDSTHFSHSIRRFYGLKPRAIFSGSRDLAIYSSAVPAPTIAGGRKKPADAGRMIANDIFAIPRVSQSKADPWATRPSLPAR